MIYDFTKARMRYENTLLNDVIPFWEKHCIDKEFGGYLINLDRDGSSYDGTKYMWMQWRVVYLFAELYLTKWSRPEWLQIARDGFDFLYDKGRDEQGRYYFALNRAGEPAMAPYNVFSECFAAMGSAMLYKATKEERYAQAAREAMNGYRTRIASGNPAGPWNKAMPGKTQYLSFGFYMMLANLGLIMDDCLGEDIYRKDIDTAFDMVLNKFWQPEHQMVFENILPDGKVNLEECQGRMLNPGHTLESMWFLLNAIEKYPEHKGDKEQICHIIESALNRGWDQKFGGIFYFMDVLNRPHLELQHDMKLWWVHNEALISTLFAYRATKEEKYLQWFDRIDQWAWSHFPDPEYGEWFAYLNRRGEPTHMLKGGKWKTFFHLPRCLKVCTEQLSLLEKGL